MSWTETPGEARPPAVGPLSSGQVELLYRGCTLFALLCVVLAGAMLLTVTYTGDLRYLTYAVWAAAGTGAPAAVVAYVHRSMRTDS